MIRFLVKLKSERVLGEEAGRRAGGDSKSRWREACRNVDKGSTEVYLKVIAHPIRGSNVYHNKWGEPVVWRQVSWTWTEVGGCL